jgi:hypothetical protein
MVPEFPILLHCLPRALPVGVLAMFIVQLYVELGDTHSAEDHLSVAATYSRGYKNRAIYGHFCLTSLD